MIAVAARHRPTDSEVKATQAQVWLALARDLSREGDRYGHSKT